jgi:hypothetical protein
MRISVQPELELLPIQTPMPRRATATSGNLERGVEILARWEVGRGLHFEVMPNGILRCDPDPTATYIEDLSAKLSNLVFVSNQCDNLFSFRLNQDEIPTTIHPIIGLRAEGCTKSGPTTSFDRSPSDSFEERII